MGTRTTIGIDMGRRTAHQAVIVCHTGDKPTRAMKVENRRESLDRLIRAAGGAKGCRVVIEPCGLAWLSVAAYLKHRGCEVISADSRSAHQFRKFMRRNVKSDRVDAEALARMVEANPERAHKVSIPSSKLFALQRLAVLRDQLVKDRAREIVRLYSCIEAYVPGLPGVLGKRQKLTAAKIFLLQHFFHPKTVIEAGVEGMRKALADAGLRVKKVDALLKRWYQAAVDAWSICEPLEASGCCPFDFDVAQTEVRVHIERILELSKRIHEIEQQSSKIYEEADPDGVVQSVPGFGKSIAPAAKALIGDIRRFRNSRALVGYIGIAPRKNQSGKSDRTGQRISKAGNKLLRQYLFIAADVARRSDPQLAAFYHRKRQEDMHHNKIIVAIANKLARRLYSVIKREADGLPAHYRFFDQNGNPIDAKESVRLTRSLYPSKKAAQTKNGRGLTTNNPGQSQDLPISKNQSRPSAAFMISHHRGLDNS